MSRKLHLEPIICSGGESGNHASGFFNSLDMTKRIEDVTCLRCLRTVDRCGLVNRDALPEIPTLIPVAVEHHEPWRRETNGVTAWVILCPLCGHLSTHGAGAGHRCSHHSCFANGGYYVGEPHPDAVEYDVPRWRDFSREWGRLKRRIVALGRVINQSYVGRAVAS